MERIGTFMNYDDYSKACDKIRAKNSEYLNLFEQPWPLRLFRFRIPWRFLHTQMYVVYAWEYKEHGSKHKKVLQMYDGLWDCEKE